MQRQLDEASSTSGSIAYDSVMMASNIVSTLLQVISQVSVVAQVLGGQRDGLLLAILCFATSMSDWMQRWTVLGSEQGQYAATGTRGRVLIARSSVGCDNEGQGLHPDGGHEVRREQHGAPQGVHHRQPIRVHGQGCVPTPSSGFTIG